MKKLTALIYILLCSLSLFATTIKVMSFNVNGQSNNIRSNEKYTNNICAIVKESGADIVLMQEFYIKQDEPELFRKRLGDTWECFSTREYIKKGFEKQNNIVFYNNRKIVPTNNKDSGIINFKIDKKYGFVKNQTQVVEFCLSGEPNKKFVVVNVHLSLYMFMENVPKERREKALNDYNKDLKALETLYSDLDSKGYKIIIGGDFNTKRTQSSGRDAGEVLLYKYPNSKMERFTGAIVDSKNLFYCHSDGGLFTCSFNKNRSEISPTLDVDHFIIRNLKVVKDTSLYLGPDRTKNTNKYPPKIFKTKMMNIDSAEYKKHVSDHLPIIIELEL